MPDANQESNHMTLCQGITTNFRSFDFSKRIDGGRKTGTRNLAPKEFSSNLDFPTHIAKMMKSVQNISV